MATTPKKNRAGKTERLDGTPDGRVLVGEPVDKKVEIAKSKGGRPTLKTTKMMDEICVRIMQGKNLVEVCEADDMPHRDSVHYWLASDKEFSDKYARACKIRREGKFYEMERIARTEEDVARARLINDTLKWQLSKEDPKKYGDKLDVTSDGEKLPTPLLGSLSIPAAKPTELNS